MGEAPAYQSGFGNHFATEARAGSLPEGQNSPQSAPFGLYTEQLSGTAFTAPRADNRRSWLYRLRPSVQHPAFAPYSGAANLRSGPFTEAQPSPNRLRWDPLPYPDEPSDFVDSLITVAGNGDVATGAGCAVHLYAATAPMVDRVFSNADGELVIVPEEGALRIASEFGLIEAAPGEIVVMPRGVRFRVELMTGRARGYVCENYGAAFRLPELGPIGANGLANARDFLSPVAWFEDRDVATQLVVKFQGALWATALDHSPLDVVAWHGNLCPYKYDLARFNVMGTVSFDHPDPSIFTVLTSPSETPGTANADFVVFPPRWMVAEHTFRPPWFHRNVMSEYMGLIKGQYDAKAEGFTPGGGSLHNQMSAHGPDKATYDRAVAADLGPVKLEDTLTFMLESRWVFRPTTWGTQTPLLQAGYDGVWAGFGKARL